MSLTVIEVLENALYNLESPSHPFQKNIGINQLKNAINQLEKDPNADADFIEESA